jgi:hypothetical protein
LTLDERARIFAKRSKVDSNWAFDNIIKFIQFQNDRVNKKDITGVKVRNYVKSSNYSAR